MSLFRHPFPLLLPAVLLSICAPKSLPAQTGGPLPSAADNFLASNVLPDAPSSSLGSPQAQQTTPSPQNETDEQRKERQRQESAAQVKAEEKQRIGGVVPDFNVVMGGSAPPLSSRQKFDLVLHSATDPFTIGTAFVFAGYDELTGAHTGYGYGPGGYFKRVGARYADTVDGALIGNAILPSLLHQDPRYFRKGTGSIKSRIIYSALTTVICHGDNGHRQFNVSNVAGNFIAGAISNLYYPANERGIGLVFETGATVTAEGTVAAQLLEFSPDLIAALKRRHQAAQARKSATKSPTITP